VSFLPVLQAASAVATLEAQGAAQIKGVRQARVACGGAVTIEDGLVDVAELYLGAGAEIVYLGVAVQADRLREVRVRLVIFAERQPSLAAHLVSLGILWLALDQRVGIEEDIIPVAALHVGQPARLPGRHIRGVELQRARQVGDGVGVLQAIEMNGAPRSLGGGQAGLLDKLATIGSSAHECAPLVVENIRSRTV